MYHWSSHVELDILKTDVNKRHFLDCFWRGVHIHVSENLQLIWVLNTHITIHKLYCLIVHEYKGQTVAQQTKTLSGWLSSQINYKSLAGFNVWFEDVSNYKHLSNQAYYPLIYRAKSESIRKFSPYIWGDFCMKQSLWIAVKDYSDSTGLRWMDLHVHSTFLFHFASGNDCSVNWR